MPAAQLFLIDAHALCYRSFFAIRELRNSSGQATNAVYGVVSTLRKILKDFEPQYMAVCFDTKAKTRRQEKFAEYKIQRPKMPDDLISQIPIIQDVVRAYRLPVFAVEGYEADDVIATLAKKVSWAGLEVVIVSDDKDMFQLVSDKIRIFSSRQDKILDAADVEKILGVPPQHVPDFIALAGDKIDNIPGVKGVGEVYAQKLIKQFGGLENILANIDAVPGKGLKEKIAADKTMAVLSKELAVLEADVPLKADLEALKVAPPDGTKLLEIFTRLEFKKFAQEVAVKVEVEEDQPAKMIENAKAAAGLVSAIREKGFFAFGVAVPEGSDDLFQKSALFVTADGENIWQLPIERYDWLQAVWEDEGVTKITHDIKIKLKILIPRGYAIKGPVFDVMLAGYLLFPGRADYSLSTLAWNYLKTTASVPGHFGRAAALVFRLYDLLREELKAKDLLRLLEEIEIPLAAVLAKMEMAGVALDVRHLESLSSECHKKMDGLRQELFKLAGEEFNLNSPKQLSHVLFEKLQLPAVKRTKTGFSTDEEVLTRLAQKHELPALLLEYRQLAKLQSTYIDALPKLIDPATKRVHASFDQTGTETGRLSSNNPNLQNIPIRTELGREIRKCFVASAGNVILSADYSQIDLRILAHLSGDETLHKAFAEDQDVHTFTAALIFEVDQKDVTKEMRDTAKRVNFGIAYGMSAFGLAKDLGIKQEEAQDFIDRYFLRYPKIRAFMDQQIKKCEADGFVTTLLNHRRYIPEIKSDNLNVRQFAQRQAINTPVQGSAADLMKVAMLKVDGAIQAKQFKARLIINVHDELVFDAPAGEAKEMAGLLKQNMENCLKLTVPVRVTVKQGRNWAQMEKVN